MPHTAHSPRSSRASRQQPQHGFTLIEAVMVIVLSGIVLAVVGKFIVAPVQAYIAVSARANLVDAADGALRRIGRDLHGALPNSARATADGLSLELIPTTAAARFATDGTGALQFGTADTSFDVVGPGLALTAGQAVVVYNLGTGVTGSDAYAANGTATEQASSNRRSTTNAAGTASTVGLSSLAGLPVAGLSSPYRVFAVNSPVTYRCDLTAGTLVRWTGYGFFASQPSPPSGGSSTVLASGVIACRFSVDNTVIASRAGLAQMSLTLATATATATESVSLHHAVHIDNQP